MYPGIILIITAFVMAFVLVVITVPPIIRVATAKKIFDENNHRKVHRHVVPAIGGVSIFIALTLSTIISTDGYTVDSLKYILAALIMLFFIGLKDDILVISAKKKFAVQLLASLLLITLGDVHISNFQWVFYIRDISYPFSVLITLLFVLGTINAYNMIDGIDGLASGLGVLSSTVFGTWFYLAGDIPWAIMSFAMSGSLVGFFLFNVFGKENKLFMGDTGSMIIGLVSAVLAIHFVEMNLNPSVPHVFFGSPAVAYAILIVPLFDLVRVFAFRISRRRSPFFADNNHIHHRLLKLVPSHLRISLIIIGINLLLVLLSFYLSYQKLAVNIHLLILTALVALFSFVPEVFIRRNGNRPPD